MIKNDYATNMYNLKINFNKKNTEILMNVVCPILNTKRLPLTKTILDYYLPSIYRSKCFNDGELPFKIEVQNTEVGHLFEHILLEYLCDFKIKTGCKNVTYMGETSWNWVKNKRGTFKIVVNCFKCDKEIFVKALASTIFLFEMIMKSKEREIGLPIPSLLLPVFT